MAESSPDKHYRARMYVERWCDNMKAADVDWAAASDPTPRYNCVGFALGVPLKWGPRYYRDGICINPEYHWPDEAPADGSIEAYVRAAELEGFSVSPDAAWEEGFETIMFYFAERDRSFTHVALQVSPGAWASKLGDWSDFTHTQEGLDSRDYGTGRIFMKRSWPNARPLRSPRLP